MAMTTLRKIVSSCACRSGGGRERTARVLSELCRRDRWSLIAEIRSQWSLIESALSRVFLAALASLHCVPHPHFQVVFIISQSDVAPFSQMTAFPLPRSMPESDTTYRSSIQFPSFAIRDNTLLQSGPTVLLTRRPCTREQRLFSLGFGHMRERWLARDL